MVADVTFDRPPNDNGLSPSGYGVTSTSDLERIRMSASSVVAGAEVQREDWRVVGQSHSSPNIRFWRPAILAEVRRQTADIITRHEKVGCHIAPHPGIPVPAAA
jgi:hypothetical protein